MPKLSRKFWEELHKEHVAFACWPKPIFNYLLDKVYGTQGGKTSYTNPMNVDEDTLMVFLVKTENPIAPGEPIIGPGPG